MNILQFRIQLTKISLGKLESFEKDKYNSPTLKHMSAYSFVYQYAILFIYI